MKIGTAKCDVMAPVQVILSVIGCQRWRELRYLELFLTSEGHEIDYIGALATVIQALYHTGGEESYATSKLLTDQSGLIYSHKLWIVTKNCDHGYQCTKLGFSEE